MIYYRGTRIQFDEWETQCRIIEGIPLDNTGKINQVNGIDAPNNQRTIRYAKCIVHPDNSNDVIWSDIKYIPEGMIILTEEEAITEGFIKEFLL